MTTENEAVGAEALEQVQVGGDAPQPEETTQEAPAQDAGAEGETDEAADQADGQPDGDKPRKKGGFQRQIEKVTREKYEIELRAQQLAQENDELRRKQSQTADDPGEAPKMENFKHIQDFLEAQEKWAKAVGRKEGAEQSSKEQTERQQRDQALRVRAAFAAREEMFTQEAPDYAQVVAPFGKVIMGNPVLAEFVTEEAMGPKVAYHLARNPAVLMEIAKLPPIAAGRELFKLEERLKSPPPPKTVTKAPDPIKTVGSQEALKKSLAELAEKDDASDYIQRRKRQMMGKS